mmetsp:Transcript_4306/g.12555  ORF Transcript_4306/g.12555 Transcript_4306/m.12555 type:complete len:239 (-) Transcript_4306:150-866(-)
MRNLIPSSVLWSKKSSIDFRSFKSIDFPEYECRDRLGILPLPTLMLPAHEAGNRGPGSPTSKSLLKKDSFRWWRTLDSFSIRARSFSMYVEELSGDTKKSPSPRLSDRKGLKSSLNTSAFVMLSLPSSRQDQNSLPTTGWVATSTCASTVSSKLNLSKLRSTPRGPGCRVDLGPTKVWAIRPAMGAPMEVTARSCAATGRARSTRKRSRPKDTPPYTLCMVVKTPSGLPSDAPLCRRT